MRFDNFAYETGKQREKIDDATRKLTAVEERLAAIDTEEEEGRAAIAKADDNLRSLNEKLRLFEVGMEHKTGEAKVIGERIASFRRQLQTAADDVEYSLRRTQEIDALTASGAARAEKNEKRAKQIGAECAELEKKLREADARVVAFDRISDEKRASELSSVESLADVRANVGSLSARHDAVSERIGEVKEAIGKADARRTEYERQLADCRKDKAACAAFLDGKPARAAALTGDIADLRRSRQKLTEDIVHCNTSIANLNNNLEMYVNLKNRFDGYRD